MKNLEKPTIRGRFTPTELAVLAAALRRLPAAWHVRRARCDRRRCYAYSPGGVIVLAGSAVGLACKLWKLSGKAPGYKQNLYYFFRLSGKKC